MKKFPTHIVAVFGVVVNENEEVLLLKHSHHNIWMFPGGQVENGENLLDALKREAMEESSMTIEVDKLFCVTSNTSTYQGYNGYGMVPTKVVMGFRCKYVDGIYRDSNETMGHIWIHRDKVLEHLVVPDFIEKYKAYLDPSEVVHYLEYESKPEYKLNYSGTI